MSSYKEHQNLIKRFKLQATKELPEARFFDRHVGLLYTSRGTPMKINKKGMSDLYGIVTVDNKALHIEIECKTGNATLSKDQRIWRTFCETRNIHFFILRNVDETIDEIRKIVYK
jgi:hypothetical protein